MATLDEMPKDLRRLPRACMSPAGGPDRGEPRACIACGICYAREPHVFRREPDGKAAVKAPKQWWSPLGDRIVRACPTGAITVEQHWPPSD
ncbi:MAG: ferredoxin [Gemmatimonadales bacterium]